MGQRIWLDHLRRALLVSGELQRLIEEDGVTGVVWNPEVFEQVVAGSHDYDDAVRGLVHLGREVAEIEAGLLVDDARRAADLLRPVYDETGGREGYVSLGLSPHVAYDAEGTIAAARRLWREVARPNVLIQVPATREALAAIRALIGEGVNVDATFLFGRSRYGEVRDAYLGGLEDRAARAAPLDRVASIASFFLGPIDVAADARLDAMAASGRTVHALRGQAAIACARLAYQDFRQSFESERFRRLADLGARPQRLCWASTRNLEPEYGDLRYVEALIGPNTVSTMALETLSAYRRHGDPAARLETGLDEARRVLADLGRVGVDLEELALGPLLDARIRRCVRARDRLKRTLAEARGEPMERRALDDETESAVRERLRLLGEAGFARRLWRRDPTLWTRDPEIASGIERAQGWLVVADQMQVHLDELRRFAREVRQDGIRQVVLLGMGGSSLAPMAFGEVFGGGSGLPLTVLDTSDPHAIRSVESGLSLRETLFVVASKSGTTVETRALCDWFWERAQCLGPREAGRRFVVITSPGSSLAELAARRGFRRVFTNFADIGGRYSALSFFGLVPAVLAGVEVSELIARALEMARACASCVDLEDNPGVALGALLGELALRGRDKVTFLVPGAIAPLGAWLEQLLAESTGKDGRGLLPVAGEPPGDPDVYGSDRVFVVFRVGGEEDEGLDRLARALAEAGQPVVTLLLRDRYDLGRELLRWEIATATAGCVLGINPFDQPNVQESKDNTRELLAGGRLPDASPAVADDKLALYTDEAGDTVTDTLRRFFAQARSGDYVGLQAWLPEREPVERALSDLRRRLRARLGLATTLGFGPRYLHSTGQFHKGGPNTGLFLQLTARRDDAGLRIPGRDYGFATLMRAQAEGDLQALRRHHRRVIRVDLGDDAVAGLEALARAVDAALAGETG